MKQHFYTHLIEVDSVYTVLDLMDLTTEEKNDLIVVVESTVHHVVIETVLSELSEDDKKLFLAHVVHDRHDQVWKILNDKTRNIDKKIRRAIDKLKNEFHKDIKKVKNKSK